MAQVEHALLTDCTAKTDSPFYDVRSRSRILTPLPENPMLQLTLQISTFLLTEKINNIIFQVMMAMVVIELALARDNPWTACKRKRDATDSLILFSARRIL